MPVIADSHCHAWRRWPYDAAVPDADHRGSVESLLYEMDQNEVDRALVVCARIGHEIGPDYANDDNNAYVADAVACHPDRLWMAADLDCMWREEYHTPGAPDRLRALLDRFDLAGFTHYVRDPVDGWLTSDDGQAVFELAAQHGLLASLAVPPSWQAQVREIARAHPSVPVLIHHQGGVRLDSPTFDDDLAEVVAGADVPNICIKLSGHHYLTDPSWDYPYTEAHRRVTEPLLQAFGPRRLLWGSDFPAARWHQTYTQSLDMFRVESHGLSADDIGRVRGGNLDELLHR